MSLSLDATLQIICKTVRLHLNLGDIEYHLVREDLLTPCNGYSYNIIVILNIFQYLKVISSGNNPERFARCLISPYCFVEYLLVTFLIDLVILTPEPMDLILRFTRLLFVW